jgi:dTDP-4-dehydrorhamnose 3,5-epimerase-like enzyme
VTSVHDCHVLALPKVERLEGNLTAVTGGVEIPFRIARVYYLYDVVGGAARGGHAHKQLEQLIVAAMGSFTVVLDDGRERRNVELNRGYEGLYMPRMIWREIVNFSSGGICVVLASRPYEEEDYIRDYDDFLAAKGVAG